jgi:arylsulfatase
VRGARLLIVVLFAAACGSSSAPPQGKKLPNVLLVSLCSVRADHMSLYGYRRETTPHIDALAKQAVVFDKAFSQWPKTVPAFSALLTGKYPHTTGVLRVTTGQRLADEQQTIGEVFAAAGYDTGAFVSSAALHAGTNVYQGFDTSLVDYKNPDRFAKITEAAREWITARSDAPWFAWVHYNNAHYPYRYGPEGVFVGDRFYDATKRVKVNDTPLPLPVPEDHPIRRQIVRPDLGGVHQRALLSERPEELDYYIARYDEGIYGADQLVGALVDALRAAGRLDNTIIAVVGDHGEALGEHNFFFEHGRFAYDDTLHVPLLVVPVGGTTPRRVEPPVHAFSVVPTVIQLAGLPVPAGVEAPSLVPWIEGQTPPAAPVFSEAGYQYDYLLAVRDDGWKLIHAPNPLDRAIMTGSEYELYDLGSDPGETKNRAADEPARVEDMRATLETWAQPWRDKAYGGNTATHDEPLAPDLTEQLRTLGYVE